MTDLEKVYTVIGEYLIDGADACGPLLDEQLRETHRAIGAQLGIQAEPAPSGE